MSGSSVVIIDVESSHLAHVMPVAFLTSPFYESKVNEHGCAVRG